MPIFSELTPDKKTHLNSLFAKAEHDVFESFEREFKEKIASGEIEQSDINQADDSGKTMLMKAASRPLKVSTKQLLLFLLKQGAEPDLTDHDGNSALDIASQTGLSRKEGLLFAIDYEKFRPLIHDDILLKNIAIQILQHSKFSTKLVEYIEPQLNLDWENMQEILLNPNQELQKKIFEKVRNIMKEEIMYSPKQKPAESIKTLEELALEATVLEVMNSVKAMLNISKKSPLTNSQKAEMVSEPDEAAAKSLIERERARREALKAEKPKPIHLTNSQKAAMVSKPGSKSAITSRSSATKSIKIEKAEMVSRPDDEAAAKSLIERERASRKDLKAGQSSKIYLTNSQKGALVSEPGTKAAPSSRRAKESRFAKVENSSKDGASR